MAVCVCSKLSTADSLVLGAVQIMIGIFHVFMWYFLLILYMGQIRGVFGTYEPITYKAGCPLWGVIFIIAGVSIIRVAKHPTPGVITFALIMNISCIITSLIASVLTIIELSSFNSVSYRNYGQAKLGREVSRILLLSYSLEISVALTYAIFGCIGLAIQIMTGLIVHFVGQLWTYLFTTQVIAFGKAYLPLVVITRYAYWSSVCFLFSGVFAVLTERMRSTFLMSYTIAVNIISACAAVIGLLILSFEFIIYSLTTQAPIWPERSGKILSEYLFLFTILELFTACTVAHWIYKAKHLR